MWPQQLKASGREGPGLSKKGEVHRTERLGPCQGPYIHSQCISEMGSFSLKPGKKDNATALTHGQLDDLVEHDVWGHVEIEDKVLKGKGQA